MVTTMQDILNRRLKEYLIAEERVLHGQAYVVAGRSLTMSDLADIRKAIDDLIAQGAFVDVEPPKPGRVRRVVFTE